MISPADQNRILDALIIADAGGCTIVYRDDLNPGQTIVGVRIENALA